jgi:tetratricopeptide (TPR) repeat protein
MTERAIIRRLARSGSAQRAWEAFCAAGYDSASADAGLLTLKGRLLKDLAMRASGDERIALLRRAAEAYSAASVLTEDSYPRINAATLVYLRGDRPTAARLAADLLELLDQGRHGAETPYWRGATRAEALLLMGRIADAREALAQAVALAPKAREDRAATLRQFRRILSHDDADSSWLADFALPPVMHFRGPMGIVGDEAERAIVEAVRGIGPAMAYGALAAGTDIVAAEAAVAGGAELHVVLPSDTERFRAGSVEPLGGDWATRFDRLLERADGLEILEEEGGLTPASVRLADDMAMGLAVAEAIACDSEPVMLRARWSGADDVPLLAAPHRLLTVTLDQRSDARAVPLSGPDTPWCTVDHCGESDHEQIALSAISGLPGRVSPGDVVDIHVATEPDSISPRLTGLRQVADPEHILLSRPAALLVIAQCEGARPTLAGVIDGPAGPLEVYDLDGR